MPGIPSFIIGRNNKLIFSVTVLMQDNSDIYLETVDHKTGMYLHNNTWVPLQQQKRRLQVKGEKEARTVMRKVTRRGPLLETVIGGRNKRCNPIGEDVSIAWAGMASTYDNLATILTLSTQTDIHLFMADGL